MRRTIWSLAMCLVCVSYLFASSVVVHAVGMQLVDERVQTGIAGCHDAHEQEHNLPDADCFNNCLSEYGTIAAVVVKQKISVYEYTDYTTHATLPLWEKLTGYLGTVFRSERVTTAWPDSSTYIGITQKNE